VLVALALVGVDVAWKNGHDRDALATATGGVADRK
jgi:hypothetical protein